MHACRSRDDPPKVPIFTGGREKRSNQVQMLTTAVSEMAKAICHPTSTSTTPPTCVSAISQESVPTGISPGKIANLRTNYLQQMRDLHSLFENGALSDTEFQELKVPILQQLKKLNQS